MKLRTVEERVVLSVPIKDHTKVCSDCGAPSIYRFFEVEPTIGTFGHIYLEVGNEWYWCGRCSIGG